MGVETFQSVAKLDGTTAAGIAMAQAICSLYEMMMKNLKEKKEASFWPQ